MASYCVDVDEEMKRTAEDLTMAVRRRVDDKPRVLNAADELGKCDLCLQARKRGAKAEVDATAKAEMLVVVTFEVHLVRIWEAIRITVSGAVHHVDRRAL